MARVKVCHSHGGKKIVSFEKRLVQAVKEKREANGLSIRALAAEVGISFSTLARIERGDGRPDNNSKVRLLQWLGPDAEKAGLRFDDVAFVHFRAGKNIRSSTVRTLLRAADCLQRSMGSHGDRKDQHDTDDQASAESDSISKEELEQIAEKFRADLQLSHDEPLDSLRIEVDGVQAMPVGKETNCLDAQTVKHLRRDASSEWSAMTVPLDLANENWVILLNDSHTVERQRVTLLEEFWHILLGHRLTKIARVAEAYGRTFDKAEEHDAYYLASATLLPKAAIIDAVNKGQKSAQIARKFGTSPELVDYRIKRLGLWWEHMGKQVKLSPN